MSVSGRRSRGILRTPFEHAFNACCNNRYAPATHICSRHYNRTDSLFVDLSSSLYCCHLTFISSHVITAVRLLGRFLAQVTSTGRRAVLDGGSGGFDPPQEVADPPESSAEPLWGVDSNPLKKPDSIFLLNQYIYVQLYAAYA